MDKDSESSDSSVSSLSGQIDIQRTVFKNTGRIRTSDRHRTGFFGKSGQKRDKDWTLGWGHLPSEAKASKPCNIYIFGWVKWNCKILFAIVSFWILLQFEFNLNELPEVV